MKKMAFISLLSLFCRLGMAGADSQTLLNIRIANYTEIFSRENVFTFQEQTWADLHKAVNNRFAVYKAQLEKDWGLSGETLYGAFVLNVVSNLWGLGDVRQPDGTYIRPACVMNNRYLKPPEAVPDSTGTMFHLTKLFPQTYLNSPVGCCNDYAMLVYLLLKQAGIEALQVGFPGHIYVEAKLDGKPYVLDAMFNFMVQMTNVEFLKQPLDQEVVYFVFTYRMSDPFSNIFRHRVGAARNSYLVTQGRKTSDAPKNYPNWNNFEEYMKQNYVYSVNPTSDGISPYEVSEQLY